MANNKKSVLFLKMINEMKDISGFLNVHKINENTHKGFKWIYRYKEEGKIKQITSIHLFILKHIVTSRGLPWKVIDESQARKSVKLEKSKYPIFDNGYGVLYLSSVDRRLHPLNGFWRYKFKKSEFIDIDLERLKKTVSNNGFPWIVLNEVNESKSFKRDMSSNFNSGVYMINKVAHEEFHGLFQWSYAYNEGGKYEFIIKDDLIGLKHEVNANVTDREKFRRAKEENAYNLEMIEKRKWSYTGIRKVSRRMKSEISQGFLWVYRFKSRGEVNELSSTDLNELKGKVLHSGFDWVIIGPIAAEEAFKQNKDNFEKYGFSTNKNKTGIFRVYKSKDNSAKQGFNWCYKCRIDNERFSFASFDLRKLKQRVLSAGFEWRIIDSELEKMSFEENEKNMKKYYC